MRAGFVALIGRPNAGKSTLLNRLVGTKLSIVSSRPQTTRNRITGIRNRRDAQVIFVDTPGLHAGRGQLGEFMQKTAERAAEEVDVICLVVDATAPDGPDDLVLAPLRAFNGPVFAALNKVDRIKPKARPERLDIRATVFVEQESQKGILIGKGGGMLKRIGTEARHELERFFGIPVFLGLTVRVRRNWRRDPRALREFGFLLTS